ncbi:zinc-dependent alcohol dehydrogenase family protein [Gimesia sp.]|uniref:zinc-dependent alcohol dehydrogenase family protein n=1 Tax=Gimesia sp. TaxID=2024833 RepID=UPI000C55CC45|nr:zinc-dependent alcohol dehydrogenase family protein [Gimesia sp.]MAX37625.1 zinc-binding dehydrogenase [Gimesia sp.]HAH47292.1 zinc-binding dehydrogenase [Planctomycetaceae bacterium]|tara:strand:+ start:17149 stop:18153 length:1005 start_codon:yes stop_codon:yes gene_type:complete
MRMIRFEQFGEPADVLKVCEASEPVAKAGEVLVRMLASPVNPSDLLNIRGGYSSRPSLPATPGFEGVGIVEASGGGLRGALFKGKRVVVLNRRTGNWAEKVVVPSEYVIPVSSRLTLEEAATFFVNPATAYILVKSLLDVPRGEWLLQTAAASAVGKMVVRLGNHYGFQTLNIVRRHDQVEQLKKAGADHVVVFNSEHDNERILVDQIRKHLGSETVKYAIDAVGGKTASSIIRILGERARMIVYGSLDRSPLDFMSRDLIRSGAILEGFWLARHMESLSLPSKLRLVSKLTGFIRSGILSTEVGKVFPLEEVVAAVIEAERTGKSGKVLIQLS